MGDLLDQLKEVEELIRQKHQPGKHSQQRHAGKRGRAGAAQPAAKKLDAKEQKLLKGVNNAMADNRTPDEIGELEYNVRKAGITVRDRNSSAFMNADDLDFDYDTTPKGMGDFLSKYGASTFKPKRRPSRGRQPYYD